MKLSRNIAPNRWKGVILVLFVFVLIQLSCCAAGAHVNSKSSASESSSSTSITDLSIGNVSVSHEYPARIASEVVLLPTASNFTRKASTKNGLTISKSAFKILHRISKEFVIPAVTYLLSPGNGNSLSKRSHDSTFALIAFVTFSTFVLFTLLPLLTFPRRQRIARGYITRFRAKNKLKPLSLSFYKPAKLSRYTRKKKPDEVSYAAVAVPIEAGPGGKGSGQGIGYGGGGGGGGTKSQQQEDFEGDVNELWSSREPESGFKFGLGPGDDIASGIKTYSIGGNSGSKYPFGGGGGGGGGWSSPEEQQPIHLSTITDSDNEYLTKDEIMYLLKTL